LKRRKKNGETTTNAKIGSLYCEGIRT